MPRLALLILLFLAAAAPAQAATRGQIIRDCADDSQLQGSYTTEELRDARENLPSDVAEYTDCADVLRRAELGDSGPEDRYGDTPTTAIPGGGFAEGAPTPTPTPPNVPETEAEQRALDEAGTVAKEPVTLGDRTVLAGVSPLRNGQPGNALPGAVVVALVLIALAAVALAVPPVRRELRRRRS